MHHYRLQCVKIKKINQQYVLSISFFIIPPLDFTSCVAAPDYDNTTHNKSYHIDTEDILMMKIVLRHSWVNSISQILISVQGAVTTTCVHRLHINTTKDTWNNPPSLILEKINEIKWEYEIN